MKRKIYEELLKWKNEENGKSAILIDGARRIGKSYIAKKFAETEYKSCIFIDFNNTPNEVKKLFEDYLFDLDTFFLYLSTFYNTKLYERESLIVFDEVQLFPKARAAIKYLVQDGRYDYLETGSLVSIKMNVKDILIPSEEHHIKMNPMDFEEFLWAMGDDTLIPFAKKMFEEKKPLGQAILRKSMTLFRQYIIVGGMPQAVKEYAESKDFEKVDVIKHDILTLYRNDIQKYAGSSVSKVTAIFDKIPAQLQKHDRKFKLADLKQNARLRDYENSFFWLSDAAILNICYNATEPSVGLSLNLDWLTMKCFMADTGLLVTHSFDENGKVSNEIYKKLMFDKLSVNFGNLMENIVAQMIVANGRKLFFFVQNSRENSEDKMEIDFLISKKTTTNQHNICPIEVKSGKRFTTTSLNKFSRKYKDQISTSYVLYDGDIKEESGTLYLPIFMAMFL